MGLWAQQLCVIPGGSQEGEGLPGCGLTEWHSEDGRFGAACLGCRPVTYQLKQLSAVSSPVGEVRHPYVCNVAAVGLARAWH